MEHTRRQYLAVGAAVIAGISGCTGSNSQLDGWEFEEREAEAWSKLDSAWSVVNAPDEYDADRQQSSYEDLDEARETYSQLSTEVFDFVDDRELAASINNFFLEMRNLARTSREYLGVVLGLNEPFSTQENLYLEAETDYEVAAESWNELDALRSAVDGERLSAVE